MRRHRALRPHTVAVAQALGGLGLTVASTTSNPSRPTRAAEPAARHPSRRLRPEPSQGGLPGQPTTAKARSGRNLARAEIRIRCESWTQEPTHGTYNGENQPIRLDGKPGADPDTHIPINPDGTHPLPEGW